MSRDLLQAALHGAAVLLQRGPGVLLLLAEELPDDFLHLAVDLPRDFPCRGKRGTSSSMRMYDKALERCKRIAKSRWRSEESVLQERIRGRTSIGNCLLVLW